MVPEDFENIDIESVQKRMAELLESKSEVNTKLSAARAEVAEIERKFQEVTNIRLTMEREQQRINNELRNMEKEIAAAKRLELVKQEQEDLRRQYEEKSKELDSLTASALWREFAYDHQIEGGKKLAIAKRGILADKRGLGKTLSGLIFCDMVKAKKILVIAPNDVVSQFQEEIQHWTKRTIMPLSGIPKAQRDFVYPMMVNMEEFVATINYEAWRRDKTIIDDMVKIGFDTIICDEAHRAKAHNKITARGIFQVAYRPNYCPSCDKIDNFCGSWVNPSTGKLDDKWAGESYWSPKCEKCGNVLKSTVSNVLSMTGTPFLNKPQELFSLLFLIDMVRFPDEASFLRDYCYRVGPNKWRFHTGGLQRLTKFMSEFFLQRTREDAGITVPPPSVTVHEIEKDAVKYHRQYKAERDITEAGCMLLENGERQDILFILELILRERQCMTWPAGIRITDPETKELICHFDVHESQKLDEATELLKELLEEGERVIVFSQFVDPLREMHRRISAEDYSGIVATGDTPKHVREQVRNDFDLKTAPENPRWQACFATYKAFGTGVNLNAARHMILLDDEWNPGMEDQAIGRIDRLNSTDQANVHIFRVKDSIDDFMVGLLEYKKSLTEDFENAPAFESFKKFFERGKE